MSIETLALGLVALASAGMAVFVWSAFVVSSDADDLMDRAHGDWPYKPDVFPPKSADFHSSVSSVGDQYDHA